MKALDRVEYENKERERDRVRVREGRARNRHAKSTRERFGGEQEEIDE